jgi:hypothetical protein
MEAGGEGRFSNIVCVVGMVMSMVVLVAIGAVLCWSSDSVIMGSQAI